MIIDVNANKAYRYGYWETSWHNEDCTETYPSYITSISSSSITAVNAYGSGGNISIGIYY